MGRQGMCSYVGIMASTPFPSFLAPIVYLEAFPHSACAGLFLRHRECVSVRRDTQQNTVRLQLWAVPPGSGLAGCNKTLCLYFPPFYFGVAWEKSIPSGMWTSSGRGIFSGLTGILWMYCICSWSSSTLSSSEEEERRGRLGERLTLSSKQTSGTTDAALAVPDKRLCKCPLPLALGGCKPSSAGGREVCAGGPTGPTCGAAVWAAALQRLSPVRHIGKGCNCKCFHPPEHISR